MCDKIGAKVYLQFAHIEYWIPNVLVGMRKSAMNAILQTTPIRVDAMHAHGRLEVAHMVFALNIASDAMKQRTTAQTTTRNAGIALV